MTAPDICIAVLAHNEAGRIATCLNSLPLGHADVDIHVVINGSTDDTAQIARSIAAATHNLTVHEYEQGGKSRSWNRFVFDELNGFSTYHIFVDGDAQLRPGSVEALCSALQNDPSANAASALPMNGRRAGYYADAMRRDHGLFGDLYALSGQFLSRMKAQNIRLPEDLIGDDGLIAAMAKTDLGNEDNWRDDRIAVCDNAGFLCEPVSLLQINSWQMQYKRMINYSVRHFQNRMITDIMRGPGPAGLPPTLSSLYPQQLPQYRPRARFPEFWFDRIALKRMAASAG
ncbi:glycosyltransferase family 2 protein [Sphingorhabdus arenilitoris]|uniref:Glycosyltransferase family 2 protein n=1 Tax=Sphingorhabdus arenilitoris TaxID=1490041 RepID=A0ABV8RCD1_9SPHN